MKFGSWTVFACSKILRLIPIQPITISSCSTFKSTVFKHTSFIFIYLIPTFIHNSVLCRAYFFPQYPLSNLYVILRPLPPSRPTPSKSAQCARFQNNGLSKVSCVRTASFLLATTIPLHSYAAPGSIEAIWGIFI